MTEAVSVHESPVGPLTLVSDGVALTGVYFATQKHGAPPTRPRSSDRIIDAARKQLDAYFKGRRQAFDVPLAPRGTAFQTRVWAALTKIPYGETMSYGAIAAAIGAPKAVRAVGAANGRNPIPIIIPCHRVIGANGSMTGFGGGIDRKDTALPRTRCAGRGAMSIADRLRCETRNVSGRIDTQCSASSMATGSRR